MHDLAHKKYLKSVLILGQMFLITFVYHILRDLKDGLVVTASNAGSTVIPFIKIWTMLPASFVASYTFSKVHQKWGQEKTLYFFASLLLLFYVLFAFCLYPLRHKLYLGSLDLYLQMVLPSGFQGLISMLSHWNITLFYLMAELWSLLILLILFWGYVNQVTTKHDAKSFYPICTLVANCAGIISGQISYNLCHTFCPHWEWEQVLKLLIIIVLLGGIGIMIINRWLHHLTPMQIALFEKRKKLAFSDSFKEIMQSKPLFYIAMMVAGFAFTTNLIEMVWKAKIKLAYPDPQAYTAYMNQLTTIIGALSVIMSLMARFFFKYFSWSQVALITPVALFITSLLFFSFHRFTIALTLGSIYYVVAMTSKYTIFDTTKEMAFLSIDEEARLRAKSVIDSIGSRLGKSGASCLSQASLIFFSTGSLYVSLLGFIVLMTIGLSIFTTKKLGEQIAFIDVNPYQKV